MSKVRESKNKVLVEALLKQKGKSYDEWLEEKHIDYIMENADTLLSALKKE
ncbi:hypothetical protein [Thermocaproicibacter melissae]|uniref:hypothetical protein n=1 Tax=Thermocaproicibacter melissae TaxID=2966552 RepID=UPI0024B1DD57|nr:hypothetical protein [Thermocaproicibacter melissae]WBY64700.1 hypothetical protein NOG13_03110 [Thermocaproicibacter melissae]